tara:strand:+ start:468 stop:866 length:399 start_codon:yes stop_codon:yes gene_type:complete
MYNELPELIDLKFNIAEFFKESIYEEIIKIPDNEFYNLVYEFKDLETLLNQLIDLVKLKLGNNLKNEIRRGKKLLPYIREADTIRRNLNLEENKINFISNLLNIYNGDIENTYYTLNNIGYSNDSLNIKKIN